MNLFYNRIDDDLEGRICSAMGAAGYYEMFELLTGERLSKLSHACDLRPGDGRGLFPPATAEPKPFPFESVACSSRMKPYHQSHPACRKTIIRCVEDLPCGFQPV